MFRLFQVRSPLQSVQDLREVCLRHAVCGRVWRLPVPLQSRLGVQVRQFPSRVRLRTRLLEVSLERNLHEEYNDREVLPRGRDQVLTSPVSWWPVPSLRRPVSQPRSVSPRLRHVSQQNLCAWKERLKSLLQKNHKQKGCIQLICRSTSPDGSDVPQLVPCGVSRQNLPGERVAMHCPPRHLR